MDAVDYCRDDYRAKANITTWYVVLNPKITKMTCVLQVLTSPLAIRWFPDKRKECAL